MEHTTAALFGPADWTRNVGKETSSTSIGIGALKRGERIITTVYPSKYPEKIWSLLFPMYLSGSVFLNVRKIDRELGETIIALDLLGMKKGRIHVGELVDTSLLKNIVKGTVVETYTPFDPEPAALREELFELPIVDNSGNTNVVVDQAFNVKGVGCVVLGFVTSGIVEKHQELFTKPGGNRTVVRSIQLHDKDHERASAGSRVGLALKNIEPEDLPRGCSLSPASSRIETMEKARMRFRISKLWKDDISGGDRFHLSNTLQFSPVRLENVRSRKDADIPALEADAVLEGRMWHMPGDRFGLAFLDSKTFRVIGSGEII
ncbi:MAG: EF-Tu/IF-2/RF-3 family GTPase [Thermoplasmatota archaeon]